MSDRLSEVEARIAELAESVKLLEGRLAAVERTAASGSPARKRAPAGAARPQSAAAKVQHEVAALGTVVSFVGRTLLVLAGAFVLRALTDSGTLPAWLGVGLGFAYAGTWIALADRAAARGRIASAAFHGASAVLIGFPLLFEAASRFRLLSAAPAAAILAAFTSVALGVAARRRHEVLAWLVALGGAGTALALMPVTGRFAPPLLYLVALGVATLWLGYVRDWVWLRWPVAIAGNVAVVALVFRAVRPGAAEGPREALLVEVVLIALYLGSIATRTLLLERPVVLFEVLQTAAVVVVGLGGASYVAARSGMGAGALGVVSVAVGLAAYAVAFAFLERQQRAKANFYFYASVAIVFVLAGTAMLVPSAALAIAWGAVAVAVAVLARRSGRWTLATHAAIYGIAAAAAAGLLSRAAEALLASPLQPWDRGSATSLAVLALVAAAAWLTRSAGARSGRDRIPRLLLVSALAVGGAGAAIGVLVPLVAGPPGPSVNAGAAATVRTAVLVAGTFLLAWAGRFDGWVEARWLVLPVLAATGVKLLFEDVARSRPATLFLAFALYGVALLVVPRLRRRPEPPPQVASSGG